MRLKVLILGVLLAVMSAGCGSTKYVNDSKGATTGQELIDLEKAYQDGIITQKQYEEQKRKILKRR